MDPNGLRHHLVRDDGWRRVDVERDASARVLRLQSERSGQALPDDALAAEAALAATPLMVDVFGNRAWFGAGNVLEVTGAVDAVVDRVGVDPADAVTDARIDAEGVVTVCASGAVVLLDARERWPSVRLVKAGFEAWKVAARADGGAWILGRDGTLACWKGTPWPDRGVVPAPGVFRPDPENPNAPRLVVVGPAAGTDRAVGIASSPAGRVAVLAWGDDGGTPVSRVYLFDAEGQPALDADGDPVGPYALSGAAHPYAIAWIGEQRVAVLVAGWATGPGSPVPEAPVYRLDDPALVVEGALDAAGEVYPLITHDGAPFAQVASGGPRFPVVGGAHATRPLLSLSLPSRARRGAAVLARGLDSGVDNTVWHRLYLEADIPPGCGLVVEAVASADPRPPRAFHHDLRTDEGVLVDPSTLAPDPDLTGLTDEEAANALLDQVFPHVAGAVRDRWSVDVIARPNDTLAERVRVERALPRSTPRLAWVPARSEFPFHEGLLTCAPVPGRSGLFTVLLQRAGLRTRSLRGRYLHLRVTLTGDGRQTPELSAVRAWAGRFSYVERYLPELYQETVFGADGDEGAPRAASAEAPEAPAEVSATRPDFLERFVDLFEGMLTPLEDRIAHAWMVTDPRTAPAEALTWLSSWIGQALDPDLDTATHRRLLRIAPELARTRGTPAGLRLALDAVTDGDVSRGRIVVLEDWRLRRTFATLLGVDLTDEDDPLLGGVTHSGNSIVGDTLILGADRDTIPGGLDDRQREELFALFAPELRTATEAAAVRRFYERLAWRVSVLVHEDMDLRRVAHVQRIARRLTPAHVQVQVLATTPGFLVGMAALVGVDTWLTREPPPSGVRLDASRLGKGDRLRRPPSIDPRLEGDSRS